MSSDNITVLTKENFDLIAAEGVVLVDFWAEWCGPCRIIAPVIEELAAEYSGKARICKVNTSEQPELAARFRVRSIPTVLIMDRGLELERLIGAQAKTAYTKALDQVTAF